MKNTVDKIYGFIAKLVMLLEDELNGIEPGSSRDALNIKKNIVNTLSRLVILIIQLNKLRQEEVNDSQEISREDRNIIKRFVEKYNSGGRL